MIQSIDKHTGEHWPTSALTPGLIFVVSCAYLLAFRSVVNMDPDEGIVLRGAQRILDGQLPCRDFFTFYTPASFYLTAALFKIFGNSITVARSGLVFFGACFPVLTFCLVRRRCNLVTSLFFAALVLTTAAPYRFLVLHNWDSTFWACLAVYSAVKWQETHRWHFAFVTGTLSSFAFLSEQSKGAGLYLGLLLALAIFWICGVRLRNSGALVVGTVWPVGVVVMFFAAKHSLTPLLDAWLWPLQHYSMANRVRYGDQSWSDTSRYQILHEGPVVVRIIVMTALSTGFVVPVLPLVALGMLPVWARRLKQGTNAASAHVVMVCALLTGLLSSVVVVRADINHFMYLAPLFYIPLAWILGLEDFAQGLLVRVRPLLWTYVVVAFGLLGVSLFFTALGSHFHVLTRRGDIRTRDRDGVIAYVQEHTAPRETMLVYPYLPLYNYLTDTVSPSRLDYFQPGMNTPEQAREILSSLQTGQVRTILFELGFADKIPSSWPETPLSAIAHDPVADYIVHEYHPCKLLRSPLGWQFEYMVPRGEACP